MTDKTPSHGKHSVDLSPKSPAVADNTLSKNKTTDQTQKKKKKVTFAEDAKSTCGGRKCVEFSRNRLSYVPGCYAPPSDDGYLNTSQPDLNGYDEEEPADEIGSDDDDFVFVAPESILEAFEEHVPFDEAVGDDEPVETRMDMEVVRDTLRFIKNILGVRVQGYR